MDVLHGIFAESDVLLMPDEIIQQLGKLLDIPLAKQLKEYLANPSANSAVVDKINRLIGEEIDAYIFPEILKDEGYTELVANLKPYALPEMLIDYDAYIEAITYIESVRNKIKPYVEPRKKEDYENFLKMLEEFDILRIEGKTYNNITLRVRANQASFYRQRESATPTAARIIAERASSLEICFKGIKYLKYCDENHVFDAVRRNF